MLGGHATIFQDVSNHFEHLQPLCCPSHPRSLNSLMHLQIPSSRFDVPLGQINHTNRRLDIYVEAIIRTLDLVI